jgi:hypothetical protein
MKIALIGNGPSGNGQGQAIDACDVVVRMKRWVTEGPMQAGFKTTALAGYDERVELPPEVLNDYSWELWVPIPPQAVRMRPCGVDIADLRWIMWAGWGRPVRWLEDEHFRPLLNYLHGPARTWPQEKTAFVSIGLCVLAIAMALKPDEIHLWGYDRDMGGGLGDHFAKRAWEANLETITHDWAAEKNIISELTQNKWLGEPTAVKGVWHRV